MANVEVGVGPVLVETVGVLGAPRIQQAGEELVGPSVDGVRVGVARVES